MTTLFVHYSQHPASCALPFIAGEAKQSYVLLRIVLKCRFAFRCTEVVFITHMRHLVVRLAFINFRPANWIYVFLAPKRRGVLTSLSMQSFDRGDGLLLERRAQRAETTDDALRSLGADHLPRLFDASLIAVHLMLLQLRPCTNARPLG